MHTYMMAAYNKTHTIVNSNNAAVVRDGGKTIPR